MNWIFRTILILVMLHPASVVLAQASITLTGPSSTSYMAPANFDLRADYYVSSGPKAEFIEDPVITQNGSPIARLLEGAVPVRGLPAGRYEYMFTGRAVRILPDGDMTSRPLRSGPIVIDVTSPPEPVDAGAPGATSYPNPSLAGRPGSVSIQMINTGETTWRAGTYVLDTPHDFTRDFWQFTAQPVTHDVAPGASFTFNFSITPRYYDQHVEWRNIEFQLRRDQSWFGLKSYTSIFVREPMNAATFESQSVPLQMEAGKQYAINVRMRNTGDDPWSSEAGYSLGSQNPANNTIWGTHRIQTGSVAPGTAGDFSATVTAPAAAGTYSFQWRMVRDGVEWFGVQTPNVVVSVVAPPPPPPPSIVGTTYEYDSLGREIGSSSDSEVGPLITTTTHLKGNRTLHSNTRGKTTVITYQAFESPDKSNAVLVEEPEDRTTAIDRDGLGFIRRIARYDDDDKLVERHYVYDLHRRMCKVVEPESGTTAFGYDEARRTIWKAPGLELPSSSNCDSGATEASNRKIRLEYDINGRLHSLTSSDGNGEQIYRYAADGKLLEVSATNLEFGDIATTRITYNNRRLITSETSSLPGQLDWTVRHSYDTNGSLAGMTLPSGNELSYSPDALGRPREIRDHQGRSFAKGIHRHANGAISSFTYGNGIEHRMVQNTRSLPAEVSATPALNFEYRYDANANVSYIADRVQGSTADRSMSYDDADRLTRVQSATNGIDQLFTYDRLDSLRRVKTTPNLDQHHHYDINHRLTNIIDSDGATVFGLSYDSSGNLSSKNGEQYRFDIQNRLRSSGTDATYGYDAFGRRVQLSLGSSGTVHRYMYLSSGAIAASGKQSGGELTEFIYLDGSIVSSINYASGSDVVLYHHTDAIGTPVAKSDTDGNVIQRSNHSAYGTSDHANYGGIGYGGHVADANSEMIYMQQRYYDPTISSFISVDPVGTDDSPTIMFNRYRYANSNPYSFTDPDGRCGSHIKDHVAQGCSSIQVNGYGAQRSLAATLGKRAKTPSSQARLIESVGGSTETLNLARESHESFVTSLLSLVAGGGLGGMKKGAKIFYNLAPKDEILPATLFAAGKIREASYSGKLTYVVKESGELIIGRSPHTSLSQGRNVLAAGEVKFVNGNVRSINNLSGHYRPNGVSAKNQAEAAFSKAGFDAAGKYVEKSF